MRRGCGGRACWRSCEVARGVLLSPSPLLWSAFCLALAAEVFVNLRRIELPERYIALGLGLAMLYMGGSMLAGMIWQPKPKDPNAPVEIPRSIRFMAGLRIAVTARSRATSCS
jgi:hypothetical protein